MRLSGERAEVRPGGGRADQRQVAQVTDGLARSRVSSPHGSARRDQGDGDATATAGMLRTTTHLSMKVIKTGA